MSTQTEYAITKRGAELATCLGIPADDTGARGLVSAIARNAATLARLAEYECNGPEWIKTPGEWTPQHSARLAKWERDLETRQDKLGRHVIALTRLLNACGVPVVPEMSGDPRGFVVRLVWPANVAVPVHSEPCPTNGRSHCTGGERGGCRAIGMDPNP